MNTLALIIGYVVLFAGSVAVLWLLFARALIAWFEITDR